MSQLIERKTDGGLAEQIEMLEAFADSDNAELLCLLLELRRRRESQAEVDQQLANSVAMAAGYAVANSKNLDRAEAAEADVELGMQLIKRLERQVLEYQAKLAEMDKQDPVLYALKFKNSNGKPERLINDNCLFRHREDAEKYGLGGNYVTQENGKIEWVANPSLNPEVIPLFTRPAPAVNLVDLVPDERNKWEGTDEEGYDIDYMEPSDIYQMGKDEGFNLCRAAILRNIEEATIPAHPVVKKSSIGWDEETNGQTIPAAKVGSVADTEVQAGSEASGEEKST